MTTIIITIVIVIIIIEIIMIIIRIVMIRIILTIIIRIVIITIIIIVMIEKINDNSRSIDNIFRKMKKVLKSEYFRIIEKLTSPSKLNVHTGA